MALVECVDPASKKLFLTRVWIGVIAQRFGGDRNRLWGSAC